MSTENLASNREAEAFRRLLGVLIVLVVGGLLMVWSQNLLNDPDTWWHLKLGSDIWNTGKFPTVDTYSHTFHGEPWIAKEWLSQLIWFFTYSVGGWDAVVLLTIFFVCLTTYLAYALFSRSLRPHLAATLTFAGIFLSSPTFIARPHIFALPIAVYWTDRLFRLADEERAPSIWLLLLVTLWANLHSSFALGFVIAGLAFAHFLLKGASIVKPGLIAWVIFLVLCPLAAMIHPYLWEPLSISLQMARANEAMKFIGEWQPFSARDNKVHEIALLTTIAALLWLRLRLSLAKIVLIVFTLHMFLSHIRFVYAFFLLTPIALASDLASQHPRLSFDNWLKDPRDGLETFLAKYSTLARSIIFSIAVLACGLFLGFARTTPPEEVSAAGAIAYADLAKLSGKVLNHYNFGGPLIFHGRQTFIDGRAEQLFLGGFITEVEKSMNVSGEPIFAGMLRKYDISWTLLSPEDPRNIFLSRMPGWTKAYDDQYAVIYKRKAP